MDDEYKNNEKYIQNSTIKYSLHKDNVINYYSRIGLPIMHLFFDTAELQKDYINTFHSKWAELMKTNGEKYLIFQDRLIMLYSLICIIYLKNIFTI